MDNKIEVKVSVITDQKVISKPVHTKNTKLDKEKQREEKRLLLAQQKKKEEADREKEMRKKQ